MKEENVYTINEKGDITFENGETLTKGEIEMRSRQAKERLKVSEAIAKARKQVEEAETDVDRMIAEGNLTNALDIREKMLKKWKDELGSLEKPRTELADKIDNGIISAFIAFFEARHNRARKVRLIQSQEMEVSLDELQKMAKEDFDGFVKYLDEKGENYELIETTKEEEMSKDIRYVFIAEEDGKENIITVQCDKMKEELGKKDFLNKLRKADCITTYRISGEELLDNIDNIMEAENKKELVENLNGVIKLNEIAGKSLMKHQISSKKDVKENMKKIDTLNSSMKDHMLQYYEESQHRINPQEIDFKPLASYGIDVRKMDEKTCKSLLSGNLSPLMEGVRISKDGKIEKIKMKFHLAKDQRGKATVVMQPALKEAIIPNKILGVKLTNNQKEELRNNGMLSKTVEVNRQGKQIKVMPYIDRETNQILLRNYNTINLVPDVEMGMGEEAKKKLRDGETVRMSNLVDNGGQPYVGYAKINPATGAVETAKAADVQYAYQVAANNSGARTEDLKNDKDTILKSGQTKNDDIQVTDIKETGKEEKKEVKKNVVSHSL